MSKYKISIIIPIYNVERYLNECINSIIDQQLESYEVILVDDGSTDMSPKICDGYKAKNIKIIHQENRGLSGARNTGILAASGEYLLFLDGDDYLNRSVDLQSILNTAEEDIIQFKFLYLYDKKRKFVHLKPTENISFNKGGSLSMQRMLKTGNFSGCATDKLIKRELILENNIFFRSGILSEDMEWTLRLFPKVTSLRTVNDELYIYRQGRSGSITHAVGKKNILDLFNIINYWYSYEYDDDGMKNTYLSFLAYHYITLLTHVNKRNCSKPMKARIYSMLPILEYDRNKKVKICKLCMKLFGVRPSLFIFRIYIKLKDKGLVKL